MTIGRTEENNNDGILDALISRCPKPLGGVVIFSGHRAVIRMAGHQVVPPLAYPPEFLNAQAGSRQGGISSEAFASALMAFLDS
jgi:hypothetical protein